MANQTTKLNEVKAHLQEGSNSNGSRKFGVKTPLVNCIFTRKAEAIAFKQLYDLATKYKA